MNQRILQLALLLGSCALLSACGSSGGGGIEQGQLMQSSSSHSSSVNESSASESSAGEMVLCERTSSVTQIQNRAQVTFIEAEAFDVCGNSASPGAMANSQIDVLSDTDTSEGAYIGQSAQGEYVEYTLVVSEGGLYAVALTSKLSTGATATQLTLLVDDEAVGSVDIQNDAWGLAPQSHIYLGGGQHRLQIRFEGTGIEFDKFTLTSAEDDTLTAIDIVRRMGTGINLGNTLDQPKGANWGAQPEQQHFFDDFKATGFGHVRIPVSWGDWTSESAPYTIDPDFLNRVEKTIDWALASGLYVIINAHHEKWFKEEYPTKNNQPTDDTPTPEQAAIIAENNARLEAIWRQVASHFKIKPKRLIFEILNEPFGMTTAQVDDLNPRLLAIMRETNPNRAVVFSGAGYTPYSDLIAAKVPAGSNLIANYHNYDPWAFAGQCAQRWGSDNDKEALRLIYQTVADWAEGYSIPVTVNEFGVALYDFEHPENICNTEDRKNYLNYHIQLQKEFGIPGTLWDDDGSFRMYDRKNRQWDESIDALAF